MGLFKEITEMDRPFLIAEAGVNHNGDIALAKKLVDAAVGAGVDCVKFQTFKTESVVTSKADMASYQEANTGVKESQQDMIRKFELGLDDFAEIKAHCDEKEIMFMSTPHSQDVVDFLDSLVPGYKTGSGDLTNLPFLRYLAGKNKPIFLSTGMATLEEVGKAIKAIQDEGNNEILVFHCTSNYPCDLEDVNLRAMHTIGKEFNVPVGYSDHTLGIDVSKLAAREGAVVLEKHFTIDRSMEGPDQVNSLEPDELGELMKALKDKDYSTSLDEELVLGSAEKKPTQSELEIADLVRKSVIADQDIPEGTVIAKDMLIIKRPGTGIPPDKIKNIIGKVSTRDIESDELLANEDFE